MVEIVFVMIELKGKLFQSWISCTRCTEDVTGFDKMSLVREILLEGGGLYNDVCLGLVE